MVRYGIVYEKGGDMNEKKCPVCGRQMSWYCIPKKGVQWWCSDCEYVTEYVETPYSKKVLRELARGDVS